MGYNHLAEIRNTALDSSVQGLSGASFISKLLSLMVTIFIVSGGVVFFFMLLIGALEWMTSGGDKARAESAKSKLSNALIGLILLFSVFAVVKLLGGVLGINLLSFDLSDVSIK